MIKHITSLFGFILLLGLVRPLYGIDISVNVYPSEEELFEEYLLGSIEYSTYLNLAEIIEDGVDSSELYLFYEIPNINYVPSRHKDSPARLEDEQTESFIAPSFTRNGETRTGYFRIRAYQRIEENGNNKTFMVLKNNIGNEWTADLRYSENYAGRQSINRRSATYRPLYGQINKLVLGNYTARFGLGLTVGYRGSVLDKSSVEVENSIAFPQYGGFNGIYIEGGRRRDEIKAMVHLDQNASHSIRLAALNFVKKYDRIRLEGIALATIIENRKSDIDYKQYQFGTFAEYAWESFNSALELAYSSNSNKAISAAVFESNYKTGAYFLGFSAWHYNDDFINPAGGARTGSSYITVDIDSVEIDWRDKRVGQDGIFLKSAITLTHDAKFKTNITVYGLNRYDKTEKILTAVEIPFLDNSIIRFDYRGEHRVNDGIQSFENEFRAEYSFSLTDFKIRSYLGYENIDSQDNLSWFARGVLKTAAYGTIEFWLNLDKIDIDNSEIDYFYGYVMESIELTTFLDMSAKYSYRFNRNSDTKRLSTFMLEVKMKW